MLVWFVLMLNWRYMWSELDSSSQIFQLFTSLDPELFVIVRSMIELSPLELSKVGAVIFHYVGFTS